MDNGLRATLATAIVGGIVVVGINAPTGGSTAQATARGALSKESVDLLEQTGEIFGRIADVVAPAVVYIEAKQRDKKGAVYSEESGSGVVVRLEESGRPVVVTNLHVVANASPQEVEIVFADGSLAAPTRIWSDRDTDLAVLDIGAVDAPAALLGDSDDVHVGQWVLAIGSPFGLMQSVTHGIVSAKDRRRLGLPQSMRIKEFIQTDAAINPGSSGGPLINLRAEVVGINTAIASHTGGSSGVGFAIPSNIVRRVVRELTTYGRVRRAFLGVEFPRSFSHEKAQALGLPAARGALVSGVPANTPAQAAGMRPGDVVLEFAGRSVEDENHLINLVSSMEAGRTVRLTVWRDGRKTPIDVTLGDWSEYQGGTSRD
jgi:S1-C subfamily serine protease